MSWVTLAGRVGDHLGNAPVSTELLKRLARGNTADVKPWIEACGFAPRPLDEALGRATEADGQCARMYFMRPALRLSVAFIWIATAHILSATLMMGTGLGSAYYNWFTARSGDVRAMAVVLRLLAARLLAAAEDARHGGASGRRWSASANDLRSLLTVS